MLVAYIYVGPHVFEVAVDQDKRPDDILDDLRAQIQGTHAQYLECSNGSLVKIAHYEAIEITEQNKDSGNHIVGFSQRAGRRV